MGISNPFFFQEKIFHWGTKKEQKEVYVLEEDETIISLNKYGDMWEAETIAIPWIHHSQEVIVEHSKSTAVPWLLRRRSFGAMTRGLYICISIGGD